MKDKRYSARLKELKEIYSRLPADKLVVLSTTIDTVAFMDIQMKDLEEIIASGEAGTPDKQLYASMAKTRDSLIKRLMSELPPVDEGDDFDKF